MPHFTLDQVMTERSDGPDIGPSTSLLLSDTGGLTQFGAFIEILPPGSASSLRHWHAADDEMIHMLAGEVTLQEGETTAILHPGDTATFKAGAPVAHCLYNHSATEARYLVIGNRGPNEVVTYPDHDRVLHYQRMPLSRRYTDLLGQPAESPYRKPD